MQPQQQVELIQHLSATGQLEQARAQAEELLRRYPRYPTAYVLLAQIYERCGLWQDAHAVLQEAWDRFPRHRGIAEALQRLTEQLSEHTEGSAAPADDTIHEPAPTEAGSDVVPTRTELTVPLRLIETGNEATVHLQSSLVRLIPGLEFTPLRYEAAGPPSWTPIPPPPPFPEALEDAVRQAELAPLTEVTTPLEELLRRLEHARMPKPNEDAAPTPPPEEPPRGAPVVATETMARVYERQGAYQEALRIYEELARRYPDKREYYEQQQARLRALLRERDENS
jgi:tetratricopeptide (TPR) repeat protein